MAKRLPAFIRSHGLLLILLAGILIRLLLLFVDYSFDVNSHMAWGREAVKYGLSGFYERKSIERYAAVYPNYPPVPVYWFAASTFLNKWLYGAAWFLNLHIAAFPSRIMEYFDSYRILAGLTKLPAVAADIVIAWIAYLFSKRMTGRGSLWTAAAVALNPVFIYISALWGQIDSIPLAFLAASLYVLVYRPRVLAGSALFALALLSKQSAVIFIPLYLASIIRSGEPFLAVKHLLTALVTFILVFIPFYHTGPLVLFPFIIYWERMITVSGLPFVSNHAFNIWPILIGWKDIPDTLMLGPMPYRFWGYVTCASVLVPVYLLFFVRRDRVKGILYAGLLTAYTVFLLLTKIHERHLLAALPFAAILATRTRSRVAYGILSVLMMANLYHNWSVPRIEPILRILLVPVTVNLFIVLSLLTWAWYLRDFIQAREHSTAAPERPHTKQRPPHIHKSAKGRN